MEEAKHDAKREGDEFNEVLFPLPKNDDNNFYDELMTCNDAVWDLIKRINRGRKPQYIQQ